MRSGRQADLFSLSQVLFQVSQEFTELPLFQLLLLLLFIHLLFLRHNVDARPPFHAQCKRLFAVMGLLKVCFHTLCEKCNVTAPQGCQGQQLQERATLNQNHSRDKRKRASELPTTRISNKGKSAS